MTKILIFIDWFAPGYKAGGPISSNVNLIDHLKAKFEFKVITRDTDYCENQPYADVVSDQWNVAKSGASIYYFSSGKLGFRNLIKICNNTDFDVVYINGIYSLYFSLFPLIWFKYFKRKKVIVSSRGMLSDHTFSSKKSKKKLFYSLAQLLGLYHGISFHATNEEEALQIRKNINFKGKIRVAPNLPPLNKNVARELFPKNVNELQLISIARISHEKNTLFALEILAKMNTPNTRIKFDLYGTIYDSSYWNQCLEIINILPQNIKVNFCGTVEKVLIPSTLKKYHFLFMPSQGENYGHSIVESLIAGVPVIISDKTPWRQLQNAAVTQYSVLSTQKKEEVHISVGWDLPLDDKKAWVEVIEYCAQMNQEEYSRMSEAAYLYAKEFTNNKEVLEANRRLFEEEWGNDR